MKKILFFISALFIFSCSSSDDSSNNSNSDFHPPSWILGKWKQEGSGILNNSFTFSANDICFTNSGVNQCQQETIDFARQGTIKVNVVEIITNTYYSAEVKYSNGQSTTYAFNKISNTEIEFENVAGAIFIKQ